MDKLKNYKECEKCGCLINKLKMKKVKVISCDTDSFEMFYCKKCSPNYNRVYLDSISPTPIAYFQDKTVEVDEKGKEVK